jgi:hypothetical protein
MSSSKIITVLIALAIGVGLGLVYGWVIEPVEYTDVTPDLLRVDFKTDYVLMAAEAYQKDFDSDTAVRRLAMLGSEPPSAIVSAALDYAALNNFSQEEISALQALFTAMQTHQPGGIPNP